MLIAIKVQLRDAAALPAERDLCKAAVTSAKELLAYARRKNQMTNTTRSIVPRPMYMAISL
jgi:hypothetical protein